ncbi:hypothetical protein [Fimbriiglobus ruber]|uniref:Uncharacterized protein n=1 Tax=Fimbriiglobus ruber TaxID=1908690 RepID=A0A225DQD3_9BACT|nr:hypothetical protein [Fimbriiglobus ruber]OWK43501.1 hypothetical protein FRUB_03100 [Fimbriiglobus ruber]
MDDKVTRLISAALKQTESGELGWKAFDEETFSAMIGPGTVQIFRSYTKIDDDDGGLRPSTAYSIQLLDKKSQVIDDWEFNEVEMNNFMLVDSLFRAARKAAYGSNKVLDEMLSALEAGKK